MAAVSSHQPKMRIALPDEAEIRLLPRREHVCRPIRSRDLRGRTAHVGPNVGEQHEDSGNLQRRPLEDEKHALKTASFLIARDKTREAAKRGGSR